MRIFIDLDILRLRASSTEKTLVSGITAKRGDAMDLEIVFLRDGIAEALPENSTITFAAKEDGKYDAQPAILAQSFAASGTGSDTIYTGTVSLSTEALDALLLVDGDSTNDVAFVDLMAEVTWTSGDSEPTTTRTFGLRVHNDVYRGDESTPSALPDHYDVWLSNEPQTWTTEQKAQARANIGAVSADEVASDWAAPSYPRAIAVEWVDGGTTYIASLPFTSLNGLGFPTYSDGSATMEVARLPGAGEPPYAWRLLGTIYSRNLPGSLGMEESGNLFNSTEYNADPSLLPASPDLATWGAGKTVQSADITTPTSVKATGAAFLSDLGSAAELDASVGGNGSADTGKVVKFDSGGGLNARFLWIETTVGDEDAIYGSATTGSGVYSISTFGSGVYGTSTSGAGVYGNSTSGSGLKGVSTNGVGVEARSLNGIGLTAVGGAGANHARFGSSSLSNLTVSYNGSLLWTQKPDNHTGTLFPNTLSGHRAWNLPDASGTLALTSDIPTTPAEVGAATAAQGALADSALQPGDIVASGPLATLATTELAAHQSKTGTNQQLTIFTLGDSMMSDSRLPLGIQWLLHYKTPIIGYALESILTQVVSGTVSAPPANATGSQRQDLFDTGKVWLMSTGAIIRMLNSNGSTVGLYGDKANFYCLKQPGGGTATIEYSRDGGSTWASLGTLDTSGTAGEIARAALAPAATLGHYIYRITATGGPVHYIGCKVWDSTRSGVIIANGNMGGITINSTLSAPAAVRNTIAADLGRVVLITQFREGPGELTETILNNFLDAWETALPFGEIVLVEQCDTPSLAGNEFTATVNGWYRAAADARTRVLVYDINAAMGSEAERDARGFYNASARGTVTVNTSTNVLTCSAAHSFSVGGEITFSTTGTLPAPLQAWTMENPKRYFVKTAPTSTTFTISETLGGAEVDLTDSESGTHTVWQTDTIHMSDDAWRFVGADLARQLIGISNGQCPAPIFREGSGSREVMFGGFAEEFAPGNYAFRMPRLNRGRFGVVSKTNVGNTYRFGWIIKSASDGTLPDGVTLELGNDAGHKVPLGINGSGYWYYGPGAAPANAETIGARAVWEENANGKSVSGFYHQGAPTVPVLRAGINASGTRTDKFQVWADGKVSQFPPASATPGAVNGELVVEATNNTTLTFKLKGTDGTVRTGTITLA